MTIWTILLLITAAALWWGFKDAESQITLLTMLRTFGSFLFSYFIVLIIWVTYALGMARDWW